MNALSAQNQPAITKLQTAEKLLQQDGSQFQTVLDEVLNLPDEPANYYVKGKAYRLMAQASAIRSRKSEQIEQLFKSYWYFNLLGDPGEITEAHRLIGCYYLQIQLYDQADEFLLKAYDLANTNDNLLAKSKIKSNQAQLHANLNHVDSALRLFNESIVLANQLKYRQGLCENWNRLSYLYWSTNQPEKMLDCMRQALRFKPDNQDTVAILYGDMGLAYLQNNQLDSANRFLTEALQLINQGNNHQQQLIITKFLFDLRKKQNRLPEAIEYLEVHDSLRKMIFTNELRNEVSYAETKYKQLETTKRLEEINEKGKRLATALLIGIILLALMTFLALRLRKNNRTILAQKKEINLALANLTEKENLLRQLFNNSPCLILTHTMDGKIISTNHIAQTVFKLSDEEFKHRHMTEFIPTVYKDQFVGYTAALRYSGFSKGWLKVTDGLGQVRVLRYESKAMSSSQTESYVIGFAIDDTEAFNARTEAEQERKRLRTIMDNSPDIYSILQQDGTITFINRSNIFKVNEIIGNNIRQFLPTEYGNRFMEKVKKVFDNNVFLESEESLQDRIYLTKLIPIAINDVVNEVLTINTDITDLKKSQELEKKLNLKIERSEQRYRQLVEESLVVIASHDPNGILFSINQSAMKLLGYLPEEMIGYNLMKFTAQDHEEQFKNYLEEIRTTGTFEGFLSLYTKQGERRIFLCRNILLKEENVILVSAQDVTAWKQSELREKKINEELLLAKEEAEESNRLKTIFLGSLSHEVRTPLQGILGLAEILENPELTLETRGTYLNIIKQRTADMQNIIEALLDLASIESGEIKPFPVQTNLYEFAESMYERAKQDPLLVGKIIELRHENNLKSNAVALVDPQHLLQVATNLVRNAIKFTNQGNIILAYHESDHAYEISISDTGIGISNDKIEHIFKPFRQAHEGISRSKGGIGLGLSICNKMVEMWG
ncbi:MAG: PAS domain S-box protein, partial [Cytophagia bacterium]|nr:PAS domain S-box protein [Cytophagia bacterium]